MVNIPTPSIENMLYFIAGVLIGLPAPYWYAAERIQGFTRYVLVKLPYAPPPGMSEEEAMEETERQEKGQE